MENNHLWWGYRHISGTYQVKRYFDERDIKDAYMSDFVEQVVRPFSAKNREDALKIIKIKCNGNRTRICI